MFRTFFPKGIAKGEQFFNRETELKRLVGNIKNGVHTLLMAPRRYGKTSLAKTALRQTGFPFAEMDLFVAMSDIDVGEKIILAVTELIQQVSSEPEQWFNSLRDFFNQSHKKWTIGIKGLKLELIPDNPKTVAQNILDALEALEHILKKKKSKGVLYFDEFQEILTTETGQSIEGAIRHFAQECEQVIFIFSGSDRKMLKKIFNDRTRPLFSLCDEIKLHRIPASYYVDYLKKVSQETYGQALDDKVIQEILELSARHPKYVYLLAFEVWFACEDKLPTVEAVRSIWKEYVTLKRKDVRAELENRSQSQLKVLMNIAKGHTRALSSNENQQKLLLSSSAISQALKVLEEHDFIERTLEEEYRIIDPLIASSLKLTA